jgi:ferredoxin
MAHFIIREECILCGACATECPEEAISEIEEAYIIDADKCVDCGDCALICPQECIVGPDEELKEAPEDEESEESDDY